VNWEKLFKRYIWDDERTPYLVPAGRMTRKQADYEIFGYALFFCTLFSIVFLVALSAGGMSDLVAIYIFSAIAGTVVLAVTKHLYAAYYCSTVPVTALLGFLYFGFPANLAPIDQLVVIAFTLIWLRYSWRLISIAKAYSDMPGDGGRDD
jgi:hypothetical protein